MDVVEIKLDGPSMNALGSEAMQRLLDEIKEAGGRPLLLTSAGPAFSAGLDLKEVASLDHLGMERFLKLLERMVRALFSYPGPTCAVIDGHAIAGGCILALCCDVRVASDKPKARIGLNEVALGLHFPPNLLRMVLYRLPVHHREEVVLTGGLFSPPEALRLGLIDAVSDEAEALGRRKLERLAALPPLAYADAKLKLRAEAMTSDPEEDRRFLSESLSTWTSPELKARLLAIIGK